MHSDLLDLIDENDQVIGSSTRKKMRSRNLLHRTAHVLIFNSKGELFITKRSEKKDNEAGKYEIGQGGVAEIGESYEDSAKRELEEELGIRSDLEYLFDLKYFGKKTKYFAKVYRCLWDGEIKLQESEIQSGRFISLKKLKEMVEKQSELFTEDAKTILERYLLFSKLKN